MDIKSIILDIDGVIVGNKPGVNTPDPHPDVIEAMKSIREKGIYISLITSKPYFAISKIVESARLNNLHVADGGSVIIDPTEKTIAAKNLVPNEKGKKLIEAFLKNNIYTEFYTIDDYFVQKDQVSDITQKHEFVLQRKPIIVDSLVEKIDKQNVTKIMPIALDTNYKSGVEKVFKPFTESLSIYWAVHPVASPLQFGVVTRSGISKTHGVIQIAEDSNVGFDYILAVGDSQSDWSFIQLCKYKVAMGNADEQLKELVKSNGGYVGPSVDGNGILEVFKHFNL